MLKEVQAHCIGAYVTMSALTAEYHHASTALTRSKQGERCRCRPMADGIALSRGLDAPCDGRGSTSWADQPQLCSTCYFLTHFVLELST